MLPVQSLSRRFDDNRKTMEDMGESAGKPLRIAIFGGTFDPPHRAHLVVACAAAKRFHLDLVLFVPVGRQPLKLQGAMASYADRFEMVSLLCKRCQTECGDTAFSASKLDEPRPDHKPNYTVDTLKRLRSKLADAQQPADVFVIVGADAFLDLRKWRSPDALLTNADWIVVSRPGFSVADLKSLQLTPDQRSHVHVLNDVEEPESATALRERLRMGEECDFWLTPEVSQYIREYGLYRR